MYLFSEVVWRWFRLSGCNLLEEFIDMLVIYVATSEIFIFKRFNHISINLTVLPKNFSNFNVDVFG